MTIREFITELQQFPPDAKVAVFAAFDSNGPNTWYPPTMWLDEAQGVVEIEADEDAPEVKPGKRL